MEPRCHQMANELRLMSIEGKEAASAFMAAYRVWVDARSTYGNGMAVAKSKPACVTYVDLSRKAAQACVNAEQCYWQRPFDHPDNRASGIPFEAWARARQARGLPT